jgi:hypothetical protein
MVLSTATSLSDVEPQRWTYEMDGLCTEHLFRRPEFAGPGPDAHASEQGEISLAVDPAVEVAPGRRDAALPLQHTQMVRVTP